MTNHPATRAVTTAIADAMHQAGGGAGDDLATLRIVAAVSGGPDSLALLAGLRDLFPASQIIVAHLNHQLRPEANEEADAVEQLANAWGLTLVTGTVDVAKLARREKRSLETAARLARYDFLANAARDHDATIILTGHHAGDQAETVLMHILRGAGTAGLRGMATVAPVPGHPDLTLLRPLLTLEPEMLEACCREQGLTPTDDASNRDTRFLRNRIRHEVLPLLATINPQVEARLRDLAAVVSADYALLESVVDNAWANILLASGTGWLHLDQRAWLALPLALRRATLRRAVRLLQPDLDDWSFAALEGQRTTLEAVTTGARIDLPGELQLTLRYNVVEIAVGATGSPPQSSYPQLLTAAEFALAVPGRVQLAGGWAITAKQVEVASLAAVAENADPWVAFVAQPDAPLVVRPRRPGELLAPLGLDGRYAKVKEIMINRKLPAPQRALWPIVATSQAAVWLVGLVIAHSSRLTTAPVTAVELRCQPGE